MFRCQNLTVLSSNLTSKILIKTTMPSSTSFEIIAGTYEEYLLGYIFSSEEQTLVHSFASHDHSSSVRCLTSHGNYLASGASDDRIIIYDLKARKEHCMLTHHNSTISALAFTNKHSHIISASQDGALGIVRVGNWQLEKLWEKAHKGGYILDITLHSSGKLALTLGTDGTIRTWNLVKGRAAYIINLNTKCKDPKSLERIIFAPDDIRFVVFGGKYTEVWSIEIGGVLEVIEHEQRVTCCDWLDNNTLVIGYEDGNLGTIDLETGKKKMTQGHNGRVKVIQHFESYIVTASSTGQLKIWTRKLKEITSVDTGCRITCLCLSELIGKLKKEEPEEETTVQQEVVKKPVKRSVVVEVEGSSDEDGRQIVTKKRNKNKKKDNLMKGNKVVVKNDDVEETKKPGKKKNKAKRSSIQAKVDNINQINISSEKITNKKKNKEITGQSQQKIKKKKRKIRSENI